MRRYQVDVTFSQTLYGVVRVEVDAEDEAQAKSLAVDEADPDCADFQEADFSECENLVIVSSEDLPPEAEEPDEAQGRLFEEETI